MTRGSCGVAGPPCPYKISALGHAPCCSWGARSGPTGSNRYGSGGTVLLWQITEYMAAPVSTKIHFYFTHMLYLKVCTIFSSINSDSYHLLTLGPSPTAQIRTMVLGDETYTFSSCYYFWYFSSRHTRTNFLKELLQFPTVARKFVATHSVWKHGLFMPLTRYQKHPFHQPKVWGKLPT